MTDFIQKAFVETNIQDIEKTFTITKAVIQDLKRQGYEISLEAHERAVNEACRTLDDILQQIKDIHAGKQ